MNSVKRAWQFFFGPNSRALQFLFVLWVNFLPHKLPRADYRIIFLLLRLFLQKVFYSIYLWRWINITYGALMPEINGASPPW
jgi:hypothetical protein